MSLSPEAEALLRAYQVIDKATNNEHAPLITEGLIEWELRGEFSGLRITPAGRDYLTRDEVVVAEGEICGFGQDYIEIACPIGYSDNAEVKPEIGKRVIVRVIKEVK